MSIEQNYAKEQAAAQYSSIIGMLAAVDCDYDRLEELRNEREELESDVKDCDDMNDASVHSLEQQVKARDIAQFALAQWDIENAEELAQLTSDAGECTSQDDAAERIQEDPLSIEVRSDWSNPGEPLTPSEFCILLCTGGPAVRIRGELDSHGQPDRAWLEYQDWGIPWHEYFVTGSGETLVRYAQQFYFGE